MSLFANYIFETRGVRIIEGIHGFATYLISGDECYVEDVYVINDQRLNGVGSKMMNQIRSIAGESKCKWLTTTVNGRFNDPDTSLKSCLAYGFRISKIMDDVILLKMEI